MELIRVVMIAVGCVVLGVIGGFAARSWLAGVILAVFVFIGWVLWRTFKSQQENKKNIDDQDKDQA